jgi:hypothetical protein
VLSGLAHGDTRSYFNFAAQDHESLGGGLYVGDADAQNICPATWITLWIAAAFLGHEAERIISPRGKQAGGKNEQAGCSQKVKSTEKQSVSK